MLDGKYEAASLNLDYAGPQVVKLYWNTETTCQQKRLIISENRNYLTIEDSQNFVNSLNVKWKFTTESVCMDRWIL